MVKAVEQSGHLSKIVCEHMSWLGLTQAATKKDALELLGVLADGQEKAVGMHSHLEAR